jgi:hypothetical protein
MQPVTKVRQQRDAIIRIPPATAPFRDQVDDLA